MAATRPDIGFVGRRAYLHRFEELLELSAGGAAAAVLLAGDAGVGKTSLLDQVAVRARRAGALVLLGRCVDLGAGGLAYLPFSEALTQLVRAGDLAAGAAATGDGALAVHATRVLREVAERQPVLRRLAGAPLQLPPTEQAVERLPLFDAVFAALDELSRLAPLVLLLEDLHWADASTRDLLRFLLSRLGSGERRLVVGSYRSDDLHRRHPLRPLVSELVRLPGVELMELPAFDEQELRDYLGALQGEAVAEPVLQDIAERSEGNAFFAGELLAAGGGRVAELPAVLADVLLARVEQLAEPAQAVARAASVAGQRVGDRLLREVLAAALNGGEEEAIRETVAHHVLVPDGAERYTFRHALLQEALYHDLLPGERARLHAGYARVLAAGGPAVAAELARHCIASNDLPGALAASISAGDEAVRRLAPAEAREQYEQALRLWPSVPGERRPVGVDEVEIGLRAASAASGGGDFGRAVRLAEQALAAARPDQPLRRAAARSALALHLYHVDRYREAEHQARAASAALLDEPASPAGVWAAAIQVRLAGVSADLETARRVSGPAIEQARELGLQQAEADLLTSLALAEGTVGNPADAIARLDDMCRQLVRTGEPAAALRVGYNLGLTHLDVGDLSTATAVLRATLAAAGPAGLAMSVYAIEARRALASTLYVAGDWDDLTATVAREPRPRDALAVRSTQVVELAVLAARDPAAAVAMLEDSPDGPGLIGSGSHFVYAGWAEALTWLGRPADAVAVIERGLARLDREDPNDLAGIWLCALAVGALADGLHAGTDPGPADALRSRGAQFAGDALRRGELGKPRLALLGPEGRAWLARTRAELARLAGEDDPTIWAATVQAFDVGYRYEQARCRLHWAQSLLRAGQRTDAGVQARQARAVAVELRARPLRDAVDVLARRGRLDLGSGRAPGPGAVLTPREIEVMRLVAEGLTNRQVGAKLFISEKTASVHVSNVLAKLGASGRTEAVSIAHRRGLLDEAPGRPDGDRR